jgi:hypothetical protein
MLVAAHEKVRKHRAPAVLFESDALNLPLRDASLDLPDVIPKHCDSVRAIQRPMPRELPVTSATRPLRSNIC